MANVMEIIVRAVDQASKVLNEVSKSGTKVAATLKSASESLSKTGKLLSATVTLPLVGAAAAAVKFASDTYESVNKVDESFKQAADYVHEWSQGTLKAYGIARGTALDMAALFGDMGTSMGQSREEAAQMSTSLVGLAADMASFKNIGVDQAADALRGIFTGQTLSLTALGIVMNETTLEAYALANGYEKTIEEMTQAEKVQLRYNFVMDATKNAHGDFARTSSGTANQMRIAQESVKELAASLGEQLLPIITPIIAKVNEWLQAFTALDKDTKRTILTIGGIVAAVGPVLLILGSLAGAVSKVITTFGVVSTAISNAGGVMALITSPASIAIAAIAALVAVGYLLWKNWDEIKAKVIEVWEAISSAATAVWEAITGFLTGVWETISTTARTVWDSLKAFFSEWWETLLVVFTGGLGWIILYVIKNWDDIVAATKRVWDSVVAFFTGIWETIKGIFGPPIQWIIDTLSGAWESIKTSIQTAWDSIVTWLGGVWTGIKTLYENTFGKMIDKALEFGKNIMESLKKGIGSVKLPIPKFSLEWKDGPLGVKIPNIGFGINWKSLSDLVPFLANGGIINRPVLLSDLATGRPVGVAGEAGKEVITPFGKAPSMGNSRIESLLTAILAALNEKGRLTPEQHFHVGTMIGDERSVREFMRRVFDFIVQENARLGVETI